MNSGNGVCQGESRAMHYPDVEAAFSSPGRKAASAGFRVKIAMFYQIPVLVRRLYELRIRNNSVAGKVKVAFGYILGK